jgi:hypothetical protein
LEVYLTKQELKQILVWAENAIEGGHFGDGNIVLPEEEITLKKIKNHEDGNISLGIYDIKIIKYWAESILGSSLKGMISEEISVLEKLKLA